MLIHAESARGSLVWLDGTEGMGRDGMKNASLRGCGGADLCAEDCRSLQVKKVLHGPTRSFFLFGLEHLEHTIRYGEAADHVESRRDNRHRANRSAA